jgi:PIN domain nuclease of toxin-antitoxin system
MIVLDTHAWLWWISEPGRLSHAARQVIDGAGAIGVSTFSAWEVTMLVRKGRISLDRDVATWVRQALAIEPIVRIAPTAEIAVAAGLLDAEDFPGDPADRIIYATAKATGASLVTRDEALRRFDARTAIW